MNAQPPEIKEGAFLPDAFLEVFDDQNVVVKKSIREKFKNKEIVLITPI
jgi:hypothetical protein